MAISLTKVMLKIKLFLNASFIPGKPFAPLSPWGPVEKKRKNFNCFIF